MNEKTIEALKLALEALEEIHPGNMTPMAEGNWNKAITAIREALAEQPAQQEPVAQEWRYYFSHSGATGKPDEVVGPCFTDKKEVAFGVGCFDQTSLYPPASKPLTDEQMFELAEIAWRHGWASCRDAEYVGEEAEDERWGMVGAEVVQDIAAHGIKGDA